MNAFEGKGLWARYVLLADDDAINVDVLKDSKQLASLRFASDKLEVWLEDEGGLNLSDEESTQALVDAIRAGLLRISESLRASRNEVDT